MEIGDSNAITKMCTYVTFEEADMLVILSMLLVANIVFIFYCNIYSMCRLLQYILCVSFIAIYIVFILYCNIYCVCRLLQYILCLLMASLCSVPQRPSSYNVISLVNVINKLCGETIRLQ